MVLTAKTKISKNLLEFFFLLQVFVVILVVVFHKHLDYDRYQGLPLDNYMEQSSNFFIANSFDE